jgi:hypothetical protein
MQYVIVRIIPSIVLERDTVAIVYGPYDVQGCRAAYRKLVAAGLADGDARLEIRGLFATGDSPEVTTKVTEIKPGTGVPIVGEPIKATLRAPTCECGAPWDAEFGGYACAK